MREFTACILVSGGILERQCTACILVSGGILGDATIDSVYSGD